MNEPIFKPLHPKFTGRFPVSKAKKPSSFKDVSELTTAKSVSLVDLDRGICTCAHGHPFVQVDDSTTYATTYCIHKMQVLAKITRTDPDELMWPYTKALATRYNKYEVVSAFHKELRRGDYDKAIYWGMILSTSRGMKGVVKYLLNILYEETRDHELGTFLLNQYRHGLAGTLTIANVCNAVALFCASTKKWELPDRLAIFEDEMDGYKALAAKHTYRVAQGKEIIDAKHIPMLTQQLLAGFAEGNRAQVQFGLKGLFKSKSELTHEKHKDYILSLLVKVMNGRYPNAFRLPPSSAPDVLLDFLIARKAVVGEHGYHELNAFCDLLTGESYTAGLMATAAIKKIMAEPKKTIEPGIIRQIPIYAHDNHTWSGKAKLKKYSWQLGNQVEQTDIDFRWCGAYLGVAYRYLAYKQHGTLDVEWKQVKWPVALHNHVMKMFY